MSEKYFKYEFLGDTEKYIISENFKVLSAYNFNNIIYYSVTNINLRKIKLLIISNDKNWKFLKDILFKLKETTINEIIEDNLAHELTKSINEEILKKVRGYDNDLI